VGTASIVLGIVGLTIFWVPGLGWLGVLMGVLGCVAGVPSITHWYHRPGYGPWGISGLILGVGAADLSLAFQVKYAAGGLDALVVAMSPTVASLLFVLFAGICAAGLVTARKMHRTAGVFLASVGLVGLVLVGSWGLITADRAYEAAPANALALK